MPDQGTLGPPVEPRRPWLAERLGIPPVQWSLPLIGLCVFTYAVVGYKLPVGDLGIGLAALGLLLQLGSVRLPAPVWLYAGFMLWAFVSSLSSSYAGLAIDTIVERLKVLAVIVVIVNALRTEGQVRFYLIFFLACYVLYPVRGTLVGGDDRGGRAVWNYIYSNSNDLATLCLLALGMALGCMFARPSRVSVRLGGAISAMLLLLVILLTQSRGAFIGLVVGMGPALFWSGLKRPARLAVSAVIVALVVVQFVPDKVWDRLSGIEKLTDSSTIAQADREGSAAERYEVQKAAWQIFLDHPLFGIGLGAYPYENAKYAPHVGLMDTHNTYLNLAAELGWPGLLLWCTLVLSVLRYARRARRHAPPSELTTQQAWLERALCAYLAAALFGSYSKLTFVYIVIAVLWCSANVVESQQAAADKTGAAGAGKAEA